MTQFTDFALAKPIKQRVAENGYTTPSPIQQQAIPPALEGKDILGIAQTGTGKTAAFSLPSIHHLLNNKRKPGRNECRMLVLAPTRELARQIADSMIGYSKGLGLYVTSAFGGVPINRQKRILQRGVDVLVATPGRLLDLHDQRSLDLGKVEILVLDEADQMLDLGFIVPLKKIVPLLPRKRQSLFFSATMPKTISQLADQFLTNPVQVSVAPQSTTAERVNQKVTYIEQADKQRLLKDFVNQENPDHMLVFTQTKHGADKVVKNLNAVGIHAAAIHGNKSQPQRERALGDFRKGKINILVATDIAARGIDVDGVSHVINFDMPNVPEQYVHRIGRTARAGASGISFSMVAPDERQFLRDIVKLTGVKPDVVPLPEGYDEPSREEVAPRIYGQKPKRYSAKPTRGGPPKNKHSNRKGRPGGGPKKKGGPKHWNNAAKSFKRRQKRKVDA
ncbi:MAG: DEAD/DEAH box helicase [Pseudomonadota bacterium]